jgi:hypothetical protein
VFCGDNEPVFGTGSRPSTRQADNDAIEAPFRAWAGVILILKRAREKQLIRVGGREICASLGWTRGDGSHESKTRVGVVASPLLKTSEIDRRLVDKRDG